MVVYHKLSRRWSVEFESGLGENATKLVCRADDSQRCKIGESLRTVSAFSRNSWPVATRGGAAVRVLPLSAQLSGGVFVSGSRLLEA
jgi:hypothetical protein